MSSTTIDTQADPVVKSSRDALRSLGELLALRPEDTNVVAWKDTLTGLNTRLEELHANAMTIDETRSQAALSDFGSSAHQLYSDLDALGSTIIEDLIERAGLANKAELKDKTSWSEDESKQKETLQRLTPVRNRLQWLSEKWRTNKGSTKGSQAEDGTMSSNKQKGEKENATSTLGSAGETPQEDESLKSGVASTLTRKKPAQPETLASSTATLNRAKASTVPETRKAVDVTPASDPASSGASGIDTASAAAPSSVGGKVMRSSARPTESTDTGSSKAATATSAETNGKNDSEASEKLAAPRPARTLNSTASTASTASAASTAPSVEQGANSGTMTRSAPLPAEPAVSTPSSTAAATSDKTMVDAVLAATSKTSAALPTKPAPSSVDSAADPVVKKAGTHTTTPNRAAALKRRLAVAAPSVPDESLAAEKKEKGVESTVVAKEA